MINQLTGLLIFASFLTFVTCHQNDDSSDSNANGELPSGLGRLIFKQMRFRDLPTLSKADEDIYSEQMFRPWEDKSEDQSLEVGKRDRQQKLVRDLAAILSNMREQETGSTLRMPSLRFG